MPQITLEYTGNVAIADADALAEKVHAVLVEQLPTALDNCRTRIMRHETYRVSDGAPDKGFVHLKVEILKGRDLQVRIGVGNILLEILKASVSHPGVSITVALSELPEVYLKG